MAKNIYEKLAEHLDKLPGGFPPSPSGIELRLLKKLFTPKEAKLAMHLTLDREDAKMIARRAKLNFGEVKQRLNEMARQGLIFSIESEDAPPLYHAVPWAIGIYQFQANNQDESFFRDVGEYISTRSKPSRPPSIPQLRTIPIERSIEPHLEALPYERAGELIKTHTKFAVAPCICRRKAKKTGAGCDSPKETCLIFGEWADYYVRNGTARYIDRSEVAEILVTAEKAKLVLQPNNSKEMVVLCCCCSCCCAVLTRIKPHPKPSDLVASRFRAKHESETCVACGTCMDRCQINALLPEGDRVVFNADRCIGCGLCVSTCPTGSLTLTRKPESEQMKIPADMDATWRELSQL